MKEKIFPFKVNNKNYQCVNGIFIAIINEQIDLKKNNTIKKIV